MRGGITLRHGTGPFVRDPFRATSLEGGAKRPRSCVDFVSIAWSRNEVLY